MTIFLSLYSSPKGAKSVSRITPFISSSFDSVFGFPYNTKQSSLVLCRQLNSVDQKSQNVRKVIVVETDARERPTWNKFILIEISCSFNWIADCVWLFVGICAQGLRFIRGRCIACDKKEDFKNRKIFNSCDNSCGKEVEWKLKNVSIIVVHENYPSTGYFPTFNTSNLVRTKMYPSSTILAHFNKVTINIKELKWNLLRTFWLLNDKLLCSMMTTDFPKL